MAGILLACPRKKSKGGLEHLSASHVIRQRLLLTQRRKQTRFAGCKVILPYRPDLVAYQEMPPLVIYDRDYTIPSRPLSHHGWSSVLADALFLALTFPSLTPWTSLKN